MFILFQVAKDQLKEIIETFNVKVTVKDVFARCCKCNSDAYILVPSSTMSALCLKVDCNNSAPSTSSPSSNTWVKCPGGRINLATGLTGAGVRVQADSVHASTLENTHTFYVCSQCGKCYWDGSHYSRILSGRLKNIVEGAAVLNTGDGSTSVGE